MDYQEEQAQELEILASIYTEDEFERTRYYPKSNDRDITHGIHNKSHTTYR